MDLSSLDTTLPPALADAERDMGEKFRGAALSITTLYKSSLAYTKQAYHVGYSAALSDVLSKVQSDIGAGEDAAVALARLMDWSEARQAAIRTFATEDDEAPLQAPRAQSAATSMPQRQATPQRPSSAPVADARARLARDGPGPSSLREQMDAEESTPTRLQPGRPANASAVLERVPETLSAHVPSSSPLPSPSTSTTRPLAAQSRSQRTLPRPASNVPTSNFNFTLPATFSIPTLELPPAGSGPAQTGPVGAKRPIIDAEMAEGQPSTPRSGRASKRRTLISAEDDKERGSGERRRGGPRRGHGGASL